MNFGRDLLQKLAEEVLKQPMFAQALATAFQKGLETKGRVDRNIQTVLSLLNLPSRNDISRLNAKIEVLQGTVGNLTRQLDKLVAAEERRRKRLDAKRAARNAQAGG